MVQDWLARHHLFVCDLTLDALDAVIQRVA